MPRLDARVCLPHAPGAPEKLRGGGGVIARQAMINEGLRGCPIEAAELASLDGGGLARVEHLVLEMTRAELRPERIPQKLQQLHPLRPSRPRPAHVAIDIRRRVRRA